MSFSRFALNWLLRGTMFGAVVLGLAGCGTVVRPAVQFPTRDQWVEAHLPAAGAPVKPGPVVGGAAPAALPTAYLEVLANHDPVIRNARGPRPLTLGQIPYTRGLYCHANSRVVVHLPGAGRAFTALAGVDSNPDTFGGRGSVVFSLTVSGKKVFETAVLRENSPAVPVRVDLAGADSFVLDVGDAGDGISCDQADWAQAKATLVDGRDVWLGDLPLVDRRAEGAPLPERRSAWPFSFTYQGTPSDELLARWPQKVETRKLDAQRTQRTLTWTDPATPLEVRCVAVVYADFPAVEWTVYFRNTGTHNTAILENIQGLDMALQRGTGGEYVLHSNRGDWCAREGYQPWETTLGPGSTKRYAPHGGRATDGPEGWPYFKLQQPGGGLLLAIGWPGQWACSFVRDANDGLRIAAGQELTRMYLQPGETIRSPLTALLFWQGTDLVAAQNLWRRWMWAYNVPRNAAGQLPAPMLLGNTSGEFNEMTGANEENQKWFISRYLEERIPIDYWWMDAGWYACHGQWPLTGTWEPDPERFPKGLRAISDYGHAHGVKTLVWFEPERVGDKGSYLGKDHPDWLLGGTLLNLGNPAARTWLTEHTAATLAAQGIDLYRQDFNMEPLDYWRGHDGPDRQGVTENLHVQGYLAYWDALRQRNPNLLIDSCASGGRRNDLETLRRAVPLHPTDYNYGDLPAKQLFHRTLFQWIPYFGSNNVPGASGGTYAFRSGHAMSLVVGYDMRDKKWDYDLARKLAAEWRTMVSCYTGDFYPLTPGVLSDDVWMAWQFNCPAEGRGIVEAYRHKGNAERQRTFVLGGLAAAARYEVTDQNTGAVTKVSGADLMGRGLGVEITETPGSALVMYRRCP